MKQTFIIHKSKDGVISGVNPLIKHIEGHSGYKFRLEVEQYRAKRSDQQNRYLHWLFTEFTKCLNELGNDFKPPVVKELLKAKFALVDVINEATGECIGQRIKGTSEMNKIELAEFIDKVIQYGAEMFGFNLPYPNEVITMGLG